LPPERSAASVEWSSRGPEPDRSRPSDANWKARLEHGLEYRCAHSGRRPAIPRQRPVLPDAPIRCDKQTGREDRLAEGEGRAEVEGWQHAWTGNGPAARRGSCSIPLWGWTDHSEEGPVGDRVEDSGPSQVPVERDSQLPLVAADGGWLLTLRPLHEAGCTGWNRSIFFVGLGPSLQGSTTTASARGRVWH